MDFRLNIPGINHETFSNKRKRYKILVINLCKDVKIYNLGIKTVDFLVYFSNKIIMDNQKNVCGYFRKLNSFEITKAEDLNKYYSDFFMLSNNILEFPYVDQEYKEEFLRLLLDFMFKEGKYISFNTEVKTLFLYQIFFIVKYFIRREGEIKVGWKTLDGLNCFIVGELINNLQHIQTEEIRTYINLLLNTISYSIKGIEKNIDEIGENSIKFIIEGMFGFLKGLYGEKWEKFMNVKEKNDEFKINFSIKSKINKDNSDCFIIKHALQTISNLLLSSYFVSRKKSLFLSEANLQFLVLFSKVKILDKNLIGVLLFFISSVIEIKEIKDFFCGSGTIVELFCEKGALLNNCELEILTEFFEVVASDREIYNLFYKSPQFYRFLHKKMSDFDVVLKVDNLLDIIKTLIKFAGDKLNDVIFELNKYGIREQLDKLYVKIKEKRSQEIAHNILSVFDGEIEME